MLPFTVSLYQVDAFTRDPFKGNPAAVCLLDAPLPDAMMKSIAAEMNLSETAFVQRMDAAPWERAARFSLRWFTPKVEVPLCGHATLATAAVLFREIGVEAEELSFETRMSGVLTARSVEGGIALNFPAEPPEAYTPPAGLLAALSGIVGQTVLRAPQTKKLLVHVADADQVYAVAPDFAGLLAAASIEEIRGLIVTAAGAPPYDFISRYFAPWVGIDEDPVTGSAHSVLTPYWAGILGKDALFAFQASARGGELRVQLCGNGRVELVGDAVTVLRGSLTF